MMGAHSSISFILDPTGSMDQGQLNGSFPTCMCRAGILRYRENGGEDILALLRYGLWRTRVSEKTEAVVAPFHSWRWEIFIRMRRCGAAQTGGVVGTAERTYHREVASYLLFSIAQGIVDNMVIAPS
jgi:hypothetical protein